MKKSINRIGFKFQNELEENVAEVPVENLVVVDNTPQGFAKLMSRIEATKKLIVSSGFAKLKKAERTSVLNTLEWYIELEEEYKLKAN